MKKIVCISKNSLGAEIKKHLSVDGVECEVINFSGIPQSLLYIEEHSEKVGLIVLEGACTSGFSNGEFEDYLKNLEINVPVVSVDGENKYPTCFDRASDFSREDLDGKLGDFIKSTGNGNVAPTLNKTEKTTTDSVAHTL